MSKLMTLCVMDGIGRILTPENNHPGKEKNYAKILTIIPDNVNAEFEVRSIYLGGRREPGARSYLKDTATNEIVDRDDRYIMRGYHILISLCPTFEASSPSTAQEFIPFSLFQTLPAQPPKPTNRRNAVNSYKGKDYRFGPIRIDWVDFETMSMASHLHVGKERERSSSRGTAVCSMNGAMSHAVRWRRG